MNTRRLFLAVSVLIVSCCIESQRAAGSESSVASHGRGLVSNASEVMVPSPKTNFEPAWLGDYAAAVDQAMKDKKVLLICFDRPDSTSQRDRVNKVAADSKAVAKSLEECVLLSSSTDAKIRSKGKERALLDFPAFAEMQGNPGLTVIDYRESKSPVYGHVVTVYPVTASRQVSSKAVSSIVQLPEGTLTQRSLVLAVMLHRERPQSVNAEWNPTLASEVESHSLHQARISLQGHHNWGSRFQRINSRLGNGMLAQEVCAESWPGQPLMDAAEECVNSWRQSSGHWGAVSGRQRMFAFDMKRGSNGTWYATGLFAR